MPELLDTNIVSELPKPRPDPNVVAYISSKPLDELFLSTLTVAEIRYGILIAAEEHRRRQLQAWLDLDIRPTFEGRILSVTEEVLVRWRAILERGRKSGRTFSQPDLILAATALEHDLTLVTRNIKDFAGIEGLKLLNPWEPRS